MPVSENFQMLGTSVFQGSELILRRKGEVLRTVIDILHPIVLGHHAVVAEQIAAGLDGSVFLRLCNHLFDDIIVDFHGAVYYK